MSYARVLIAAGGFGKKSHLKRSAGHEFYPHTLTGCDERTHQGITHLIYLDAFVPQDGLSIQDIIGEKVMIGLTNACKKYGDSWRIPHNYNSPEPPSPKKTNMLLSTLVQPLSL